MFQRSRVSLSSSVVCVRGRLPATQSVPPATGYILAWREPRRVTERRRYRRSPLASKLVRYREGSSLPAHARPTCWSASSCLSWMTSDAFAVPRVRRSEVRKGRRVRRPSLRCEPRSSSARPSFDSLKRRCDLRRSSSDGADWGDEWETSPRRRSYYIIGAPSPSSTPLSESVR